MRRVLLLKPQAGTPMAISESASDAALASLDYVSLSVSKIDFFGSDINVTTTLRHDIGLMPHVDFQTGLAGEREWWPWIDRHDTKRLGQSSSTDATASLQLAERMLDEVFALRI